jgi:hypothetical protein
MLQILDFISQKFNRALADYTTEMKNTMTWLDQVARERPLEDTNMVKEIMSQLTQACSDIGEFNIIHSIASDVHASTGDIDVLVGQTHETPDVTYQIINEKTCSTIVTQILLFLDQSFDDLIWCIGRLRSLGKVE